MRAFLLSSLLVGALGLSIRPANAANPASGSLGPTGPIAPFTGSWAGTATSTGASNESDCVEGVNCDTFRLTVTTADYSGKVLAIQLSWGVASNNYDLYVHKAPSSASTNAQANATTPIAHSTRSDAQRTEKVVIDPTVNGAGAYTVHVVYRTGSTSDQYTGSVTVVAQTPDIAASMTDAFPNHGDGKAREGDTIDYSVTITNNGGGTAAGTKFNDPAPANTTDVAGSVKMSALAIDDSYNTNLNTALNVPAPGVLGNDKGIPAPSAVPISGGATTGGGTVTLNADGSFSYTPANGFGGKDTFDYTATNVQPPNDVATVTITVDHAPTDIALSNSTVDENQPAGTDVGTLSTTDADAGDTQTYSLVTGAGDTDNASFQINGAVLKTAASFDFETKSSYSVRIQTDDGHGGTFAKQFTITVNNVNEAPTATDQSLSTNEDTSLPITLAGTDPESDALTFTHDPTSAHGGTISGAGASVTYTPALNYDGSDSFGFTVNDGHGHTDAGTITITVNAVNDAPVAVADSYSTNEDTPLTVAAPGVLGNDSDVDGPAMTAVLVSGPSNASSFTLNSDGSFSYTPAGNYNGSDSFSYKANDGSLDSNTVTVSLTINAVNDPPTAIDQTLSTNEDTALPIVLSGTDVDGDTLTFTVDQPAHGSVSPTNAASVTYTPAQDYNGPDSFTFTVDDGHGGTDQGTVDITVNPVNDPPVVDLDNTQPGNDTTVSFSEILTHDNSVELAPNAEVTDVDDPKLESGKIVLTNRPDGDSESIAVDTSSTPNITASAYDKVTGTITLTGNGTLDDYQKVFRTASYQNSAAPPDPTDRAIEFTVNDGDADSAVATATVQVLPINAPPIVDLDGSSTPLVFDNTASFTEDSPPVAIAPNGEVSDADDANLKKMTVTLTNRPDGVAESLSADVSGTSIALVAYDSSTGVLLLKGVDTVAHYQTVLRTVKYNNASDAPSTTTRNITVVANDGHSNSNTATSAVSVTPHNDAPTATDQSVTTDEDTGLPITLSGTDPDGDSLSFTSDSASAHGGTITGTAPNVTYHPPANYCGADSFAFTVNDGNGGADSGTVSITVNCINDPPTITDSKPAAVTMDEDGVTTAFSLTLHATDMEGDTLTWSISGAASHGTATASGTGASKAIGYTPTANYNGSDTFTVQVSDGNGGTDTIVVNVTINPINDPPTFTKGADQTVLEDSGAQTVTGWATNMSAGPSDESGQTLTFSITGNTNSALFSAAPAVANDGTLTYTPATNANGTATITVTLTDSGSNTAPNVNHSAQTFVINVTAVNDPPSFTKGANQTVNEDAAAQTINGWATAISSGPNESQTVNFIVTNDNNSLFSVQPAVSATGVLTYTLAANQNGAATVSVQIHDNGGTANGGVDTSAAQTFTITVNAVNDPPVVTPPSTFTVQANMKVVGLSGLLANVSDAADNGVNGCTSTTFTVDAASVSATSPAGGTISNLNTSTGTFDFDPPPGYTGNVTFTYQVKDTGCPGPGVDSAPVTVTLNVQGPVVWFVNPTNASPATGDGRLSNPFSSLAQATAATGTTLNQRIFVYGNGTATASGTTVTLTGSTTGTQAQAQSAAQWLIGQGAIGTDFDTVFGISPPAGTVARPSINGTRPTIQGTVTMKENTVVRGLNINVSGTAKGLTAANLSSAGSGSTLAISDVNVTSISGNAVDFSVAQTVNYTTSNASTSPNILSSGSGIALNVVTTTIGSSGLTFQKISSTGAASGIVLNTTGSSGGLTVSGNSGTCNSAANCSGGAIQNSTGPGISLISVGGPVSFTRIAVLNGGDDGIHADTVGSSAGSGIALDNSFVSGNGNAVNEAGLEYHNVFGITSITNSTITGSAENNAIVNNDSGTLRLTVNACTFSNNSTTLGGDGLAIAPVGTAVIRALVQNSTFSGNRDDGFQLNAQNDSTVDLTFDNNTVHGEGNTGAVSAHSALNFDCGGTSDVRMSMNGGTVTNSGTNAGSAIIINPAGNDSSPFATISSAFSGTFNNVTVGTSGVPLSGSATGIGMWIKPVRNVVAKIKVTNCHINGTSQFGMQFLHNDGQGTSDFTFTGNVLRTIGAGNEPIFVQAGSLSTDVITTCADIGGTFGDNAAPGNDFAGQASGGVTDIAFRRPSAASGSHLKLPGFTPPASSNLTPYIDGRNVGNPTTANFSGELESGPASCQQPTLPTLP